MKYIVMAFFWLAGTCGVLQAQTCTLTLHGQVLSKTDREPMVSAQVKLLGTNNITYTDLYGKFTLPQLCPGTYQLEISGINSETMLQTLQLQGDTTLTFYLHHHHQTLEKIILTGSTTPQITRTGQVQSLSAQKLQAYSGASLGEALSSLAGVSVLNTGKNIAKPVVQGFSGSRVPLYNHGILQADQTWGNDHAPAIDLNSISQLHVIKGASALAYSGDAIGGLVIAEAADIPRRDSLYGHSILSGFLNGRGLSVSTGLTKSFASGWYGSAQASYLKSGDYKTPDYHLTNTGIENRNYNVRLGLQKFHYGFDAYYSNYNADIGVLRASSTGSVQDLVTAINQNQPIYTHDFSYRIASPKQDVSHHLFRLKSYYYFERLGKLKLTYGYQDNQRYEYDIRRGNFKYKPSVDLHLKTQSLKAELDINTNPVYALKLGINAQHKTNTASPDTGVRRLIPDYKSDALGTYLIGHYKPDEKWLIEVGGRYDFNRIDAYKYYTKYRWEAQGYQRDFAHLIIGEYGSQWLTHPQFSYRHFSATLGLRYQTENHLEWRFNYGLNNRAPNVAELFSDGLHHSTASIELGDLRLQSEHAHKFSLSLDKTVGDWQFSISPFLNYITDFIYLQPRGFEETIRGVFLRYHYAQTNARLWGIDLKMHYQFTSHWRYLSKFSTLTGRDVKHKRYLPAIPPTKWENSLQFQWPKWHQLQLRLATEINFEKQHYPDNNFTANIIQDGHYQPTLVDISTPPSSYFLAHFQASAVFHPLKNSAWKLNFSIDNIFDTAYRNYLNRLRYYADNLGCQVKLQLIITY